MNKKIIYAIVIVLVILFSLQVINFVVGVKKDADSNIVASTTIPVYNATDTNIKVNNKKNNMEINRAKISTNMGEIVIEFNSTAPKTVENFKTLMGKGFYDGVRFHRVIKDFMIQTGDPNSKDKSKADTWGMGGPGYKFADELSGSEQYTYGTVAMANSGPSTNGSQFFIVSAKPSVGLPPSYTVFAHVLSGMEVVDKIQNVKTSYPDRPVEDVIIDHVTAQ